MRVAGSLTAIRRKPNCALIIRPSIRYEGASRSWRAIPEIAVHNGFFESVRLVEAWSTRCRHGNVRRDGE